MNRLPKKAAMPIIMAVVFFGVCLIFVPACGSSSSDPAAAAIMAKEPDGGKTVFENNCLRCHPYGKKGMGPNLSKKDLTDEEVTKQVRKGGLIMPSFSKEKITDEQLAQLAPFVVSLKQKLAEQTTK